MSGQSASREDVILVKKAYRVDIDSVTEDDEGVDVDVALGGKVIDMLDVTKTFERVVGEVLTIVDASVADKDQKKAMKSLIKQSIYDGLDDLHALSDLDREESSEEKEDKA